VTYLEEPPPRWWPLQTVYGGALAIGLSIANVIFPSINRHGPGFIWFPLPMVALGICAVAISHRLSTESQTGSGRQSIVSQLLLGFVAIAGLTAIGLALSGLDAIRHGRATLSGDLWAAPLRFRNLYSISSGFVDGLTEEASMRGVIQIPIARQVGSIKAQIITAAVFIALHTIARSGFAEFVFVALTAVVCGLLTAAFRSVWVPAVVHSATNTLIAVVDLGFRG
jgi:membrane protease YdiL (CAAX protease family)